MKFQRKSDDHVIDAKVWQRHGDHPRVRPATSADLPRSANPGAYGWIDGVGIVLPGDWVYATDAGGTGVLTERALRGDYVPCGDNPPKVQ